jgi:DNA-binding response OmpR family regulator
MATKRILVVADDPADGETFALELSREGYVAPHAHILDLPHLKMTPTPDLIAVCFSSRPERALGLAQALKEMKGVAILVVSALRLSQLEGPLRVLPIVSAVLFKPYSLASLLETVEGALAASTAGTTYLA